MWHDQDDWLDTTYIYMYKYNNDNLEQDFEIDLILCWIIPVYTRLWIESTVILQYLYKLVRIQLLNLWSAIKGLNCDRREVKANTEVENLNMANCVIVVEQMDLYCILGVVQLNCHWLHAKCVSTPLGRCFDNR